MFVDRQAPVSSETELFPYGTVPVDPVFREHYTQDFECAQSYPVPEFFPAHHPLLRRLEQISTLAYTLPPWWRTRVVELPAPWLRQVLAGVTAQEFRTGRIEQARWKAFRATLSREERRLVPASPKIATLLEEEEVAWISDFTDRGPVDTPDHCQLTISTQPLDFLYMANGRNWRSCQHMSNGGENERLPGNFYDTNVAVSMLLPEGQHIWEEESVLARTTVRVFRGHGQDILALGQTYHNHETLAYLLLWRLAAVLDASQQRWGMLTDTNTLSYCQNGFLGSALRERLADVISGESELCRFPTTWYVPWVDRGAHSWKRDWEWQHEAYYATQLHAQLHMLRPHPVPKDPTRPHLTGAPFLFRGMLPQLP